MANLLSTVTGYLFRNKKSVSGLTFNEIQLCEEFFKFIREGGDPKDYEEEIPDKAVLLEYSKYVDVRFISSKGKELRSPMFNLLTINMDPDIIDIEIPNKTTLLTVRPRYLTLI